MKFKDLVKKISLTHSILHSAASKAINKFLTIRNWLIGFYIVEYEQKGKDRAKYGEQLLYRLENEYKSSGLKGLTERRFRDFRKFYLIYPEIRQSLTAVFKENQIRQLPTADFAKLINYDRKSSIQLKTKKKKISGIPADKLLNNLSYTHIVELLKIEDDTKRAFYEIESIKGTWSVKELQRQINSLYFERSGLSKDKKKIAEYTNKNVSKLNPQHIINSPFTFEFLGLKEKDIVKETDLEQALLDNIQEFLLEMGYGFCFESRQKRIIIGDEYFYLDLVFYHRILKCHVLLELKVGEFNHSSVGQLNTYLNYYKQEIMQEEDNPPIGILLCTNKNDSLVQYATAGMDEKIFIKKYLVELPSKKELEAYIKDEIKKFEEI
ncbi:MAG: PDDEXK nuclease domain-containing protein [Candidatus Aminicenantes bacterium]|jgi:predicted nuclease of restriction endonuclease-like (RecB) superfamily